MAGERTARFKIEAENRSQDGIKSAVRDLLGIDDAAKKVGDTLKTAFTVTAIAAASKQIAEFGKECVDAYADVERSHLRLKAAFEGNETVTEKSIELMDSLAVRTTEGKDSVEQMVSALAALGKSPKQIEAISTAAVNLSNATGKDLNSSMMMLNGTFEGTAGKLSKLIPEIGDMSKAQLEAGGAIDLVNEKLAKISNELGESASQKMHNLGIAFDDLKEAIGQAAWSAPVVDGITDIVNAWASAVQGANDYRAAQDRVSAGKGTTADSETIAKRKVADMRLALDSAIKLDAESAIFAQQNGMTADNGATRAAQAALEAAIGELKDLRRRSFVAEAQFTKKQQDDEARALANQRAKESYSVIAELAEKFAAEQRKWNYKKTGSEEQFAWVDDFQFQLSEATRGMSFGPEGSKKFDDLTKALQQLKDSVATKTSSNGYISSGTSLGAGSGIGWALSNGAAVTSATVGTTGGSTGGQDSGGQTATFATTIASAFQGIPWANILSSGGGILQQLITAIAPAFEGLVTKIAAKLGPLWAIILLIVQGFTSVMGPAIDGILKPLMETFKNMGKGIATILLPIIDGLGGVFGWVSEIILTTFIPMLETFAPVIQFIAGILDIIAPILKILAVIVETVTAPLKWLGDLFKWVGEQMRIFMYNLKNPLATQAYTTFTSDAFTGLADRVKKIMETTIKPGITTKATTSKANPDSVGSWDDIGEAIWAGIDTIPFDFGDMPSVADGAGGSGGNSATYTGGQDITINFYNTGNVVSDEGITKLAVEIKNIIDNQVRLGAV